MNHSPPLTWVVDRTEQADLRGLRQRRVAATHGRSGREFDPRVLLAKHACSRTAPDRRHPPPEKLSAAHLNELYRALRVEPTDVPKNTNRRHAPESYARILSLRLRGDSYQRIATQIREEFPTEAHVTKDAVARIIARARQAEPQPAAVLSIRTVRYIHTIVSRSFREAIRLGYIANNPAASASPPRASKARVERPVWTAEQTRGISRLGPYRRLCASGRRGRSSPLPATVVERTLAPGGRTSISIKRRHVWSGP